MVRILVCSLLITSLAAAQDTKQSPKPTKHHANAQQLIVKGLDFLKSKQLPNGAWTHGEHPDPAITALAVRCFARHPEYGPKHEIVKKALAFIIQFVQIDGGIYPKDSGLRNYYTSVCLMALSATKDPQYAKQIEGAQKFLKKLQWDGGESIDPDNPWYGGAGYGRHKRPDLSNTQMMIEALHDSGLSSEDPVYQKALKFIERCQMMGSVNDQAFAKGTTDGGMIYSPANGGESKAGGVDIEGAPPRLRSYGSMTYAGFKSYIYANVKAGDPRVTAALQWIQKHYTLDTNPNMPHAQSQEGLYYYYQVFAQAFRAWGSDTITDATGVIHDWRAELISKLASLQKPDGSWVNDQDRWYEGNPILVTSYAVLALQETRQ